MLKFYHAPWSRSSNILWLMEELGVEYELEHVNVLEEGGAPESYRKVQPHKKVPAIEHDGGVITERAAIAIYLCDAFPQAGLAPKPGDPMRGPYLTWLVYADSVFDPVVAVNMLGLEYPGRGVSFGTLEDMLANLERRLAADRFIAGDRFTAADIAMAGNMAYVMSQGWLPKRPGFEDYVARATERPALKRAQEKDQALAMSVPALRAMVEAQRA